MGPSGIKRNYPYGKENFFRHFSDYPLNLKISIPQNSEAARARLRTNIYGPPDEWRDLEFNRVGGEFILNLPDIPRGRYAFRMQYSQDSGHTWNWDPVPYSHLLIDSPTMRDLRIYTLIPNLSGHVGDWISRLQHIKDMGFNAILLLPLTKMGNSRSPYAAEDLFALDPAFAIPGDSRPLEVQFRGFVNAACDLGIKLGMDLVLNHVGSSSPLVRDHPRWFFPDPFEDDGVKRAGWWKGKEWVPWSDLALLYFDHPEKNIREEIWEYMTNYALYWAQFAQETGGFIRLDNFHSCHEGFVRYVLDRLRKQHSEIFILAEIFEDWESVTEKVFEFEIDLILSTEWEEKFTPKVRRLINFLHDHGRQVKCFTPVSSHDSGPPAEEFGSVGSTVPRYALASLFGLGATGMVMGVEYGSSKKLAFIGALEKIQFTGSPVFAEPLRQLNAIMESSPVFWEGENLEFVDGGHDAILAALRLNRDKSPAFVLLANLDTRNAQSISLLLDNYRELLWNRKIRDAFQGTRLSGNTLFSPFNIEPCGIRVFEIIAN